MKQGKFSDAAVNQESIRTATCCGEAVSGEERYRTIVSEVIAEIVVGEIWWGRWGQATVGFQAFVVYYSMRYLLFHFNLTPGFSEARVPTSMPNNCFALLGLARLSEESIEVTGYRPTMR